MPAKILKTDDPIIVRRVYKKIGDFFGMPCSPATLKFPGPLWHTWSNPVCPDFYATKIPKYATRCLMLFTWIHPTTRHDKPTKLCVFLTERQEIFTAEFDFRSVFCAGTLLDCIITSDKTIFITDCYRYCNEDTTLLNINDREIFARFAALFLILKPTPDSLDIRPCEYLKFPEYVAILNPDENMLVCRANELMKYKI